GRAGIGPVHEGPALAAERARIGDRVVLVGDEEDHDERVGTEKRLALREQDGDDTGVLGLPLGREAYLLPRIGLDEEAVGALELGLEPAPLFPDAEDETFGVLHELLDLVLCARAYREVSLHGGADGASVGPSRREVGAPVVVRRRDGRAHVAAERSER